MSDTVSDTTAPFVRIVVLNWNAAWLTSRCVRSLQATEYPTDRYEIVVVDNASIDGSLQRLRADLTGVRFVENDRNYGFAEGNNRALRDLLDPTTDCDFVALVNNDAVVEPDWLAPLVAALGRDERLGAAVPKMLLESWFVTVPVIGQLTDLKVEVDGIDVTRRCIYEGVTERHHETLPLGIVRSVDGNATIHVPVGGSAGGIIRGSGSRHDIVVRSDETTTSLRVSGPGEQRINSLGTALKSWTEGYERWFGALDRPNIGEHETWGFSGGGVLLRTAMLRDVGLFDPRFFAYYEDTDLAWRARRRGWSVRCVPDSVVHHLHGGSAGPEAQGFFFLNYRNWLLTVLRNGSIRQLGTAAAVARNLSWPAFRRNVFGKVRRGKRPDIAITTAWARVAAGVAALAPSVVSARVRRSRVGSTAVDHVTSRLMPATPPRAPRRRAGGPVLVYVDVTETLRSGWRAGIQRVVCELIRNLPEADRNLELVLICWSKVHQQFRRIDAAEYASLLAPTATQQPAGAPPPPTSTRKLLAKIMHSSGAAPVVYRWRRRKELQAVSPNHRALLLDRLEPGSVFLDIDASWNPTTLERSELLPLLVAGDVDTVALQYDLFPHTHPQWFIPQMVDVFMAHLDAHLDAGSLFVCISHHTRAELERYAASRPDDRAIVPTSVVVPLGVAPVDAPSSLADSEAPYFLTVGTVEPRKNHGVVLDAFAKVRAEHPDARLVVVGRPGWNNGRVIERLTAGPEGVDWLTGVTDDELDALYRSAHAVIVASVTEGFGLPVIEALQRQAPVISSDGGSLPEAGGELVEYFDPASADDLYLLMLRHLDSPEHQQARRQLSATYVAPSWSTTARAVAAAISRA